jgi:hypothetical protein
MAKVRTGKLGKGSYKAPRGNSIFKDHRDWNPDSLKVEIKKPYFNVLTQKEALEELKDFNSRMEQNIRSIVVANRFFIAQIVKNRLYNLGTDANEDKITTEPTAMRAANAKLSSKQLRVNSRGTRTLIDRVDLYNTGTFYHSLRANYVFGKILITSDDPKKDELMEKYGKEVFQLTDKEIDWINKNIIDKEMQNRLDSITSKINFSIF